MMASFVSIPIRLQVPLERYANFSSLAGTAATAEPVSWPATAITGIGPNPVSFCTSSVRTPMGVPGLTILPNIDRVSPKEAKRRSSSCLVRGSSNCEVDAIVYSHTSFPVSIQLRASGTNKIFCACFKAELPSQRMA